MLKQAFVMATAGLAACLAVGAPNANALGIAGAKGNGAADHPSLSADGQILAFASRATNLSADDADANRDVYARNLDTGVTILVSRATGAVGTKGNGESFGPTISADGRFVAFV